MQIVLDLAFLQDPRFQATALPFLAAFLACGLIRLAGGAVRPGGAAAGAFPVPWGPLLAAAGIGVGFVTAHLTLFGPPALPPASSTEKVVLLAGAGLVLGLALDCMRAAPEVGRALAVTWAVLAVGWIAWPRLATGEVGPLVIALAAAASGIVALVRLHVPNETGLVAPIMLVAAAAGTAGVAQVGASPSLAHLALAVTAATLGYAAWNWPRPRFRFANAALLGGGGALVAVVATVALYGTPRPAPLLFLLPLFFADRLLDRWLLVPQIGGGWRDNLLAPLAQLAAAALPVGLAVGAAWLLRPGPKVPGLG